MRVFLSQFFAEVKKMGARKRTFLGFPIIGLVQLVIWFAISREHAQSQVRTKFELIGITYEEYYSSLSIALIILSLTILVLGTIYVALVAGDIVAKEADDGSLRLMLTRPVSRLRILLLKYTACTAYTLVLVVFIMGVAFLIGYIQRGWGGGMLAILPEESVYALLDFGEGMKRYLLTVPFLMLSMQTVMSIGFMFSCTRMQPSTATILTATAVLSDFVLQRMPWFAALREYFLTSKLTAWTRLFETDISWIIVSQEYIVLVGINITCFLLGWLFFESREFK